MTVKQTKNYNVSLIITIREKYKQPTAAEVPVSMKTSHILSQQLQRKNPDLQYTPIYSNITLKYITYLEKIINNVMQRAIMISQCIKSSR